MRHYWAFRTEAGNYVYVWDATLCQRPKPLPLRLDLWNHSPGGFNWGFGGSGPAQLALALAADALEDDRRAVAIHQLLKFKLLSGIREDCWAMTKNKLVDIIVRLEADHNKRGERCGQRD